MRKEFERTQACDVGIDPEAIEWLLDRLEDGFTEPHGLMIMRHGKICAEGWWAPYAPGIRHGQQSHSKTYAATAVGIACTEGILSLDERLVDIFPDKVPEEPSENLKKLRVRDVLCMGCGMDEMPEDSAHWIEDFLATPVNHTPGTVFMYNSVGSTMLGAIVREKTGLGLQAYLKPRLFDKIGIDSENLRWMQMSDGMEVGGGGLFCTTEDNLRLMKLYAEGGVWEGERILAEDFVRQAVSVQNDSSSEKAVNPGAEDNFLGYGFQIWMCKPKGVYRADGAMGQFTIVDPDKDMIIALTENASGAHWAQKVLDTIWEFLDMIGDEAVLTKKPEAEQHLKRRLNSLALPKVPYSPGSPWAAELEGKQFRLAKGTLLLDPYGLGHSLTSALEVCEISAFSLHFAADRLVMKTKEQEIVFAMDGSRRYNLIEKGLIRQTLCSAYFRADNALELTLRWIETCYEQKILLCQNDGCIRIRTYGNAADFTGEFTAVKV